MKKMNNKGFSLVELIVVVLIMAIIAVALAPQVMKWVENSRVSTDCTNYESMVENLQLAIADKDCYKTIAAATPAGTTADATVIITTEGAGFQASTAGTIKTSSLSTEETAINTAMNNVDASWQKIAKKASAEVNSKDYYVIEIYYGKQANIKKTADCPDTLKNGTDLS